jgi:CDP-6-deoxy-D-xylo-4-hexulose-3-dehydrase
MIVPVSGQVTGQPEADNVLQVAQSQHYGGGAWTRRFERGLADFMGARHAIMCNSGSSANLLALAALELPKGSEVVTCAVNFPTTVNAIIQLGLVPVFVDADPKTLNIENGWDWGYDFKDTKAIVIAHTLGNPVDISAWGIPDGLRIPIIEDCCDALGSTIHGQMVGMRGVMATASFYPAHHITTGEGGAVFTDSPKLKKIIESYRDWGRDCWCAPGCDNTCGTRYEGDYDHKYTYSRIGYNLKASDFQAAVGVAQLDRLQGFIEARKRNHKYLRAGLGSLPIQFVDATPGSDPSWFGFAFLTDQRNKLARYLDSKNIGNRPVMAGNILRQPAYRNIEHRVVGNLDGANKIHEQGLWVGCFPGLSTEQLDYTIEALHEYFA